MATSSDGQGSLGRQMFRESALKKMNSAEDLDAYLRLVNPSAWVLAGAVACLLVAAAIWACTASLPIRYSTTGVIKDGQIVSFLPGSDGTHATAASDVSVAGHASTIASIDEEPYSQREVEAVIGSDYTVASLGLSQWSYKVVVNVPDEMRSWDEGDDVPVTVTTRTVTPMAYLLGMERS